MPRGSQPQQVNNHANDAARHNTSTDQTTNKPTLTIENRPGDIERAIDEGIAATCAELSGARYPEKAPPLEGKSLVPAFANRAVDRDAIYWEHEGNRAVRAGQWKLVARHDQPWELYDIDTDRVEAQDLARQQPEKVRELSTLYDRWASRVGVAPWPLPDAR